MKLTETVRAAYGAAALIAPGAVEQMLTGQALDERARIVMRILGARHLLQAAVTARGGRALHLLGSGVDILHALTAVALAVLDERRRPVATVNAAIALTFAAAELARSRESH